MKAKTMYLTVTIVAMIIVIAFSLNTVHAEKVFKYVFEVDDEGSTNVTVFLYDCMDGSSWLLIPKDQKESLEIMIYEGELLNVTYRSLIEGGKEDPFYMIMELSYDASEAINLTIRYLMKYGALVIEPNAIFVSPRIAHEGDQTTVVAHLPAYAQTSESKVSTLSSHIRNVSISRSYERVTISAVIGSNDRLVVEYTLPIESTFSNITSGKFIFSVHPRYIDFAHEILEALDRAYTIYREIFESEPRDVLVKLFVPSIKDLTLGIKGYVPVVGRELGPIHLNVLYIRSVKGFMSLVAIHELAHHFLWSINVPVTKLWIHEGVAQYMSLIVGSLLGYHDAVDLYGSLLEDRLSKLNGYLGFVEEWTAYSTPPQEPGQYYAASYYIVRTLCDKYGGLDYLKRLFSVFKRFSSLDWYDSVKIVRAFGVAAGNIDEVLELFRGWGFKVEDSSIIDLSIPQIKESVLKMPIWLEPYRNLARIMIEAAELLQQHGLPSAAIIIARASQLIHELSYLLTLISIAIFGVVFIILFRRMA